MYLNPSHRLEVSRERLGPITLDDARCVVLYNSTVSRRSCLPLDATSPSYPPNLTKHRPSINVCSRAVGGDHAHACA